MRLISSNATGVSDTVQDISHHSFFNFQSYEEPKSVTSSDPLAGLPVIFQQDIIRHWITKRDLQNE